MLGAHSEGVAVRSLLSKLPPPADDIAPRILTRQAPTCQTAVDVRGSRQDPDESWRPATCPPGTAVRRHRPTQQHPSSQMTNIDALLDRNRAFAATDTRHTRRGCRSPPQGALHHYLHRPADRSSGVPRPELRGGDRRPHRRRPSDLRGHPGPLLHRLLGREQGTRGPLLEAAIIHHTDCGSGLLADEGLRHGFAQRTGYDEDALAELPVLDPAATVRADVERVLSDPRISPRITVSGHVYDVHTGLITTIVEPASPTASAAALAR